ncbi:MAG: methyltransferase domain-containing protein [Acidimicrobiales bacterium]
MNIHTLYNFLFRVTGTRRKRMKLFSDIMGPADDHRIIDIGGTPYNWQHLDVQPHVTLVNKNAPTQDPAELRAGMELVEGDATRLPFADDDFDIAFSNSVIEHLYNRDNQVRFVTEANRVAKRIWIQTPSREFFLEPHLITPFIHWLPDRWKRTLYRNFTVWGLMNRPTAEQVDDLVDEIQLLRRSDVDALFPDCEILVERWLGMPKSYIAYRR